MQQEVVSTLPPKVSSNLRSILKWGCNGSSGQSQYKQKFSDEESSDASIFQTSVVPLRIVGVDDQTNKKILVWVNPYPSSPRFCRPVKIQFLHENTESTGEEERYLTNQIDLLVPHSSIIDGKHVVVKYELYFTMIDNKVANAVTETKSSMRCHLCKATSKEFNDIKKMKKREIDENSLRFGLSTLHKWIPCFETLLHIGYKLRIHK